MATIPQALSQAAAHLQAGSLSGAEHICQQILAVDPYCADAWHLLGIVRAQGRRPLEAAECFQRAIQLNPAEPTYHYNLGLAYREGGSLTAAEACFLHVLQWHPGDVEAMNDLGVTLQQQRNFAEAEACFRKAVSLAPGYAAAYYNLALAVLEAGSAQEAADCLRRALQIDPHHAGSLNNLGNVLQLLGRFDEAEQCFADALRLRPDDPKARWNRALLLLLRGDFRRGWPEYEWRWRAGQTVARRFAQPLWDGRPLGGRTILLHAEQGLGDTIQFIRYAPLVRHRGAVVIVECQKPLLRLLAGVAGVDRLVAQGEPLPPFDVHAPLQSLPGILGTNLSNVPAAIPYLAADPALVEQWRERLGSAGGRRVGISWQGNPEHPCDRYRAIRLAYFAPLARLPNVSLVSLQKGAGVEQLEAFRRECPVVDFGDALDRPSGPFLDTAAILANLDLVITCDTSIAHLAGALGVRTWVALPIVPDWRWLLDRDDSPWYPTMRLFRQPKLGDWAAVFQRMAKELGGE